MKPPVRSGRVLVEVVAACDGSTGTTTLPESTTAITPPPPGATSTTEAPIKSIPGPDCRGALGLDFGRVRCGRESHLSTCLVFPSRVWVWSFIPESIAERAC